MSHSKNYSGLYIAKVADVNDPQKRCRVRVNVYDIFDGVPIDDLPWANTILPLGSRRNEGVINPMQVGDEVWVQFVNGDTRRPMILGSAQSAPGGVVNLAPDAFQGEGQFKHKRTERLPQPASPPYYEDVVYCQNRALIQLCRDGVIRITQMDSGSAIEIMNNGNMILHCEADMFVSVKGNCLEEFDGNLEQIIKGDFRQTVQGSMTQNSKGAASYGSSGSSLNLNAATQGTMTGGGGLRLEGPTSMKDNLSVEANIMAEGSITDKGGNTNHHSH